MNTTEELIDKDVKSPEELLEKIERIIVTYNEKRTTISDASLENLRAYLSVGTYLLVSYGLQPAYSDVTLTEIQFERAEGQVFMEYFEKYKKEFSSSVAMDMARKSVKQDSRYLEAYERYSTAKQYSFLLNKLLEQANQVLNSMSKRTRF